MSLFPPHQGELHVSKLFHHPSILPYKSVFIAENELWVITPFMAYGERARRRLEREPLSQPRFPPHLRGAFPGSARDLICTHFSDGMNELTIAYILLGMLKALEYIHHMGYVHR